MPAIPIVIQGATALLLAAWFAVSGLWNVYSNQLHVINHKETKNSVIFQVATEKTKKVPLEVVIPKDNKSNGKIKISFRNKGQDVEFDFEHSGELTEEYKPYVDEIMKSIVTYTKSKPTLKNKISKFIKNYVNKKL